MPKAFNIAGHTLLKSQELALEISFYSLLYMLTYYLFDIMCAKSVLCAIYLNSDMLAADDTTLSVCICPRIKLVFIVFFGEIQSIT
jgi:hypothetical protein